MTDLYIFDHFNHKSQIPDCCAPAFDHALNFLYVVTKHRPTDELAQLLVDIDDWELGMKKFSTHTNDHKYNLQHPDYYYARQQTYQLLNAMIKGTPLNQITTVKDATWPECFAVVGLGHLGFACLTEANFLRERSRLSAEETEHIGGFIGPTQEAATIGAMLFNNTTNDSLALKASGIGTAILKKAGKKGGKHRGLKYAPLRRKVCQLHDIHFAHLSALESARRIYKRLDPQDLEIGSGRKLLTSGTPEDTIARWIRAHSKGKRTAE